LKQASLLAVLLSCRGDGGSAAPLRLRATVVRPQPDTIRFSTPAVARQCIGGRGTLLEGAVIEGSGVLVLLRHADSLAAGTYPLTPLGDSTTVPGANVAARFLVSDVSHGFALDSGSVEVGGSAAAGWDARISGRGLEGVVRHTLDASFDGVPHPAPGDTVTCGFQ
jgi:hypothetical protein